MGTEYSQMLRLKIFATNLPCRFWKKTRTNILWNIFLMFAAFRSKTIEAVAKEFTSHGTKVVAVSNTGNNGWDSVMSSWLICILNTLAGSWQKGRCRLRQRSLHGSSAATMTWKMSKAGVSQDGVVSVCRNYPYESSTEYAEHVKNKENPYPAKHVYHPLYPTIPVSMPLKFCLRLLTRNLYQARLWLTGAQQSRLQRQFSLPCERLNRPFVTSETSAVWWRLMLMSTKPTRNAGSLHYSGIASCLRHGCDRNMG